MGGVHQKPIGFGRIVHPMLDDRRDVPELAPDLLRDRQKMGGFGDVRLGHRDSGKTAIVGRPAPGAVIREPRRAGQIRVAVNDPVNGNMIGFNTTPIFQVHGQCRVGDR